MPNVHTICVDLQNWDETKKAVESLVPLDHLVNNAGIAKRKPLIEIAQDECDTLFDVLVKAVLNVSQAFVKTRINHENKNGATIVNIASIVSQKSKILNNSIQRVKICCKHVFRLDKSHFQVVPFMEQPKQL